MGWEHDTGSADNGNHLPDNYRIVLEWKEEMSKARGTILGAIFTPKHEYGLKLCVAGDTDDNGLGNKE